RRRGDRDPPRGAARLRPAVRGPRRRRDGPQRAVRAPARRGVMPSARELSRAITRRARAAMKGTPLWAERRRLRQGKLDAELDPRLSSAFLLIPGLIVCSLAAPSRLEYALLVLSLATAAGALLQGARLRHRLEGEAVVPFLHLPIADHALFAVMVR